jgi:hypothetical protein
MNELIGFRSITRNVLKWLGTYGMMLSDFGKRREDSNDYDGRAAYLRGSSAYSQGDRIHSQDKVEDGRFGRDENWRAVAYHQRSAECLYQQVSATQRQKIKASICWHPTTKHLVAFRSLASVFQAVANDPWNSLPKFSIHRLPAMRKVWCIESWVCSRKEVYP